MKTITCLTSKINFGVSFISENIVNSQLEKLFDWQRQEVVGQPVELLVPHRLCSNHEGHRAGYFVDPHVWPRMRAPASDLPFAKRSSKAMAAAAGSIQNRAGVPLFILQSSSGIDLILTA